jgi:uncharacterized protein (TIGR04222 family)
MNALGFLDTPGPVFLGIFAIGGVVALIMTLIFKARASARLDQQVASQALDEVSPVELAWLRGGLIAALQAAVAGLFARGHVAIEARGRIVAKERSHGAVAGERKLEPMEEAVLGVLSRKSKAVTLGELVPMLQSVGDAIEARLVVRGALSSPSDISAAKIKCRLPFIILFLVGLIKLFIGIGLDRPVGFLVLALIACGFAIRWAGPSRAMPSIEDHLEGRRIEHAALRPAMGQCPEMLTASEVMLGVGVFGVADFAGAIGQLELRPAKSSDTSVVGGGCGSSCGGGCGGGCGGCGA